MAENKLPRGKLRGSHHPAHGFPAEGRRKLDKSPLPACRRCGQKFVTRNLWHSRGIFNIADHFKERPADVYRTYRKIVECSKPLGPATVSDQKPRIVAMHRVRFASCIIKVESLDFGLGMKRR
jgi:hypothetical protein